MTEPMFVAEAETVIVDSEGSFEQLAQQLAKLSDPDENPEQPW